MSDSEMSNVPTLGKRERSDEGDDVPPSAPAMEESDDDVGPMPLPEGASGNGAAKKKRKGAYHNY